MRLLGLAPPEGFSGFERSYFDAVETAGEEVSRSFLFARGLWLWSTLRSVHPRKKLWGLRRDRQYNTTPLAFRTKSAIARLSDRCSLQSPRS